MRTKRQTNCTSNLKSRAVSNLNEYSLHLRIFLELFALLVLALLSLSTLLFLLVVAFAYRYELLTECTQHLSIYNYIYIPNVVN